MGIWGHDEVGALRAIDDGIDTLDCLARKFLARSLCKIESGFVRRGNVAAVHARTRRDRIHVPAWIFSLKIRITDDPRRKMGRDRGYSGFNHDASARSPLLAISSPSL